MRRAPLLTLGLLAAPLSAQNCTTSPLGYESVDGGGGNTFPWSYPTGRYQQIHGDMRGSVRVITALAFRRYGVTTVYATATARTVDIELLMGDTDHATVSTTFVNNYAMPPWKVINRKMLNLPDFTQPQGAPAPWNLTIPFDTPFVQIGIRDLLWEYVLYSSTATGTYFCDFKAFTLSGNGTNTPTGTGCVATGRTLPMAITASQSATFSTQIVQASWSCANAPANAASAILVGLVNWNVPIPGLCANLMVDVVVLTVNTNSTAAGTFTSGALQFPWNPGFTGLQTHAQGAAFDAGQPNVPFSLTNGVLTTWALPVVQPIARIYLSGSPTGSIGALGNYGALVTRFTH